MTQWSSPQLLFLPASWQVEVQVSQVWPAATAVCITGTDKHQAQHDKCSAQLLWQAPGTTRQAHAPCTMTSTLAECTGSVCILSSTIHNIWCDNYIQVDCHAEIRYLRQNYSSLRSKVQALLFVALQAWQRQFCFEWMHQSNASQERVTATSGIWKGAKQAAMSYKTSSNALQNKRRFHHCRAACARSQ